MPLSGYYRMKRSNTSTNTGFKAEMQRGVKDVATRKKKTAGELKEIEKIQGK